MKKGKIISLVVCLLMMCAAAICVNRSAFGVKLVDENASEIVHGDSITRMPDGSVVIHTASLTEADGYAGPVPLDITVSPDGVITDIKTLPNAETPSFFERASSGLLGQWIGKNIAEIHPMKVDAVSGATYSSEAIKTNVDAAITAYTSHKDESAASMPWKLWVALGVTLAACIIPLFVHNKIYHNIQMAINVLVLGFWCGQYLDYALMLKYISSGFSLPAGLIAIVMLIAAFIFPLFGHPQHYCNHICPLGSAQMLAGELNKKHRIKIGPNLTKALDWFRRILWAVLMFSLWAGILTDWMDYELFQSFMFESAPIGIIITAGLFIILSVFIPKPYCRFVCPTGSLFKTCENM